MGDVQGCERCEDIYVKLQPTLKELAILSAIKSGKPIDIQGVPSFNDEGTNLIDALRNDYHEIAKYVCDGELSKENNPDNEECNRKKYYEFKLII